MTNGEKRTLIETLQVFAWIALILFLAAVASNLLTGCQSADDKTFPLPPPAEFGARGPVRMDPLPGSAEPGLNTRRA